MNIPNYIKLTLRLLLGAFFIVTAILKLFSLDHFELYIYSFNVMNFVLATVAARVIIAFEFLLGAFLMLKCFYRYVWWLMLLTLTGFTFFLIYVALFRQDSNCHCMGNLIELNPIESIIKNIISIAALIFVGKQSESVFRFKKPVIGVVFCVSILVPFVAFPMDVLYNAFRTEHAMVNPEAFEILKQDSAFVSTVDIDQDKHIIAVVASGCKFCKISSTKLNQIIDKNSLHKDKIIFVIWGDTASVRDFQNETQTRDYKYALINPLTAIDVTFGHFPTFIYTENGAVTNAVDFRGMNEEDVVTVLK
jgi:uncharacterized membrane protein YphA (DoxX/SURF4 family)